MTAMTQEQLKPCPFCGHGARIESDDLYYVECLNSDCCARSAMVLNKVLAASLWNTRAEQPAPQVPEGMVMVPREALGFAYDVVGRRAHDYPPDSTPHEQLTICAKALRAALSTESMSSDGGGNGSF